MRSFPAAALPLLLLFLVSGGGGGRRGLVMVGVAADGTTWCIARSNTVDATLQIALDYACGAGADCAPIQSNGLCYLPNTVQAHASYAMNSYYQRKARAPGSCDFAGTAVVATTDPSYGSCVYPASVSAAGGASPGTPATTPTTTTTTTPTTNPTSTTPETVGGGLSPPGLNTPEDSSAITGTRNPVAAFLCVVAVSVFFLVV
ncbi:PLASMODESMATA CALLOSE-BINDING PROTEIN 3-like [Nymphaea colorata]|nr:PLASMODESMATA CALLOSE-BINDING PROTEIN 3-like [Nymphaea colorata]